MDKDLWEGEVYQEDACEWLNHEMLEARGATAEEAYNTTLEKMAGICRAAMFWRRAMKHNLERIVDFLRLGRGNKRLLDRDAAYVMNVYLKDNLERDRIARGLGLGNRCGMCLNQCKGEAVSRHCPECRKGIIAWLEEEGETSL